MRRPLEIPVLYRDEDFLVVDKPAGISTTSPDGRDCLVERVQTIDPRAPKLHATSRLDAEVTGVVTFARTSRGVEHCLEMRREGRYRRLYLALASVAPDPSRGEWDGSIGVDPRDKRKRRVTDASGSQHAKTVYALAAPAAVGALLALYPHTGRTHQLRVHCAAAGLPLFGDVPYGGPKRSSLPDGRVVSFTRVMLHCARVSLPLPSGERVVFASPIPSDFRAAFSALGGDEAALADARVTALLGQDVLGPAKG